MSNQLYGKGRQKFLGTGGVNSIDWLNDEIRPMLVNTSLYTVDINVDEFLSDIPVGAQVTPVSDCPILGNKTSTLGVANASGATYTAVSGATCGALVLFKNTGVQGTSPLIAYIDTATGLPVAPNGGPIAIQWDTGTNKIFKL
jgi:hypothetical protein